MIIVVAWTTEGWQTTEYRNDRKGSQADILAYIPSAAALGRLADISWTRFRHSALNVRSH